MYFLLMDLDRDMLHTIPTLPRILMEEEVVRDLENFSKTRCPQILVSFYYLFFFNDTIVLKSSSFKLDHSF